jgi:chromosome segregation ATPase
MEQPHLASQLEYLEQRHLADQEKIAHLQQQTEAQAYDLQEQATKILRLEEEMSKTRLTLARVPQLDERLDNLKKELLQVVEQRYDRRQQTVVESSTGVSSQLDNHTRALNELRREVEKTHRYEEQILLARTEAERLNKTISGFESRFIELKKQLDERTRAERYAEEQRRVDTKRVAEVQSELPKLRDKVEASLSKVQMIERQIPQYGKYELALEDIREELRRHREHMDFQMAQRERLMKQWTEMAEDQDQRIKAHEKLMEKYVEHYQLNKRALTSLQEFQEQLQREQHQAEELQRLIENRQRSAMEKLQAEYEQRWQKQGLVWQPQLAGLQKEIATLSQKLEEVKKFNHNVDEHIDMILQIIEEDIQSRATASQSWQHRFEELASGRT